jgi:hypothetical protein
LRSARVFISCGQLDGREKNIGMAVKQHFADRGFETYFAELVNSSEALTENIFRFLNDSEYFVFVDFKRDVLNGDQYPGWLFVNQELAIATFLQLPGIGFTEKGVKREGILGYQIYNAVPFEDGTQILTALKEKTADWDPNSVNELTIRYDPNTTTKGTRLSNWPGNPASDWYHLEVLNRNKRKHAFACMRYVTEIHNLESDQEYNLPTIGLNWSGIGEVTANIIAGGRRDLDAFFVVQGHEHILFHERSLGTTNPRYHLPKLGPGRYKIEFAVMSANFATVASRWLLEFDGRPESVSFREIRGGKETAKT